MAASRSCRLCGAPLPVSAMTCPQCGAFTFFDPDGTRRKEHDAALVGIAGSGLMAAQSASMVLGGVLALVALSREFAGARGEAFGWLGLASIFVGFTLLFDLVGVSLLSGSFLLHAKTLRGQTAGDPRLRVRYARARATARLLLLWVIVTVAWRAALAATLRFYPTPLGANLNPVSAAELQRAASVMLVLWVLAAFLLFLGARSGARFLRDTEGRPATFWRTLWPLEALIHFVVAVGIALVAPGLLANLGLLEVTTLRIALTLGAIDVILVPALGVLAYSYLFTDFLGRLRKSRVGGMQSEPSATPAKPPEEA